MNKHLYNWLDEQEGKPKGTTIEAINAERRRQGEPEYGKQYALTGKPGDRCIANGFSWEQSEVTPEERK